MASGIHPPFEAQTALATDPFASARLMARSAGFGDDLARFIIATARGDLPLTAGAA